MKFVLVAAAVTALCACGTKRNEERCLEGLCSDPDLPFCDIDGTIGGTPNACVAVDCTPGEFASCRGDRALTCNTTGDNYDLVQCANGCDANGCKPCTTPECEKHIIPKYLPTICDQVVPGDPITITQDTTIDTTNQQNCSDVVQQVNGPDICVLRFSALTVATNRTLSVVGPRAIAIVVDRDLNIDGIFDVSANGRTNGPGGGVDASGSCSGTGGGGGAGYRTMGGSGGGSGGASGGAIGAIPTSVVDLRGGTRATASNCTPGGAGGAAVLVSCRGTIAVSGMIDAGGGGGLGNSVTMPPNSTALPPGGGGSGGTVVLQAMMINATGRFYANGGGGGGQDYSCNLTCTFGGAGADGPQSTGTAPGGLGAGVGGRGGSGTSAPTSGMASGAGAEAGGGGGGSAGFFLSYTPSGVQPTISPFAASPGFLPNGTIATN